MNIPILLVYFNRPDILSRMLEKLAQIKPKKLFLAVDGPRIGNSKDLDRIDDCNNLVKQFLNWECDVKWLIEKNNSGCNLFMPKAIDWFFEQNNFGIILEDDCLIDINFCNFTKEIDSKYKNNESIMNISAANFINFVDVRSDYIFSRIPHNWAWATWKRAWVKYNEFNSNKLNDTKTTHHIKHMKMRNPEKLYWLNFFSKVKNNKILHWDAIWLFTIWSVNGLSITPKNNYVTNIGYGNSATNTKNKENKIHDKLIESMPCKITHPEKIGIIDWYENKLFNQRYKPKLITRLKILLNRLNFNIIRLIDAFVNYHK